MKSKRKIISRMYSLTHSYLLAHTLTHSLTHSLTQDSDLSPAQLLQCIERYKKVYTELKHPFPNDVYEQLYTAIDAVFGSWNSDRAIKYRQSEG